MGFLKKKKSMQSPPSQGGKNYGITISPAHTLSSVFARSPSSATIDDARNDVGSGSEMRSVSNHSRSIADGITTASKATVKHLNSNNNNITTITTHNISVASPLSMASGGGAGKDLRDKPPTAAVATTNASNSSAPAIVVMPALTVPPSLPATTTTKKQTIDGTDTKPPNKSSPKKMQSSKKIGSTSKVVKMPRPRGILSEVCTSYSTCDDDDERDSYSDDDEEEEEEEEDDRSEESEERSATYTDDSSFVSLGYRTSHSKSSTSFGISHTTSSENTDSTSTTEEEETEREVKGSRDLTNRERRESMRFVSETETATSMSSFEVDAPKRLNGKCGTHKAKKCLKKLSTLAAKAKNESNDAAINSTKKLDGPHALRTTTTTTGKEKSVIRTFKPPKKDTIACNSVASTDANSSRASMSTAMFMKTMEEYTVKNAENQLLLKVNEHGNVQKMLLQEIECVPSPRTPADVVIKIDCSTITLQDCMIRRGHWYAMQNLPFIPGSDIVGTILSMGIDATKNSTFQIGDKVASIVRSGGNAKYITVSYQSIIRVPNEVDDNTALSMLSTYVPARESLDLARKFNTPLTGANVLIIGGNGPSGLAMIELALLEAANVYTTADERHHAYLTSLGIQCFPIDPEKWLPSLEGKMDVVLDSVCIDMYESSRRALNSTGTLVCTGMSAVYTMGHISVFGLHDVRDFKASYCKMKAKFFMYNGVYYDKMERYNSATVEFAQHFRYLCHLASKGTVKPVISTSVPLKSVASVQRAIELGETAYGVCVCRPWEGQDGSASSNKVAANSD